MKIGLFKKILIITMLFLVSFSNLPFQVISKALLTYQETQNIVDKFWNVQSDGNVVDNLQLFELAKRMEIGEASAATTANGTTWYLSNTNASTAYGTAGPTAEYAGQTDITPAVPTLKTTAKALLETPGTAAVTVGGVIGTGNTWYRTFVSPQLAAQTINSGMTFRLELAATESSASANAYTRTHVYVWRQGTGLVATLIDGTAANCVTATEYGTTGSGRVCVTSATGSNVTLQAGDQIAVEVWVQAVTGYTENILYGGPTHVIHSGANTTPMSSFSTSRAVILQTATDKGTRWFLSNTNAATAHGTAGPTAEYAGQTDITPAVPTLKTTALAMTDTPGTAATTVGGVIGTGNTWYRTFLSPKLAAQSIASGMTFKLDLAATESNVGANAYTRVNVYVWRQGMGLVSTLIDGTAANCVTATEYATTGSGRTCVTGAGAAATLQDGDQIAVEVWVQAVTGYTENILYGGPNFVIHSTANTNPMSSFATSRTVTLQTAAAAVTTISNFVTAEPGDSTIAPGASGLVNAFGLSTNSGIDTITAASVSLAAGMGQYVQTVAITNDGDTVTYCSVAPSGDTASLSSCTIPVTITNTQFKIKITADPHASMPVPPGGSYAVTATVTGWTGTNSTHAGTDSGSSTLTIDNLSPNNATAVSGSAGNAANTLNWTASNSADFNTTAGSVIYRWASGSAGAEVPVEGSLAVKGNTNGAATMACVVSSAASAVLSKIDGTGGSADCTTAALTNGQAYTYKVFTKDTNGNYNIGVLIGTFTPVEPIVLSSYTNTTETSLNYSGACTNCGARIGDGSGFRQSITITGSGFGTVTAGNRSTAANNIKVGTHQIADANVTAWTSTSITFLTDSAVTGDTDANWGTVFGGASALTITVNSVVSSGLNFYLFPQVTSITVPTATANAAREYSASDSDGIITLNGTRFGTAATGGWVRILGCDSTTCSSPTGSAATNSWSNTAIAVQVPAVIADNIYTGSVIMQQGSGTSNKSHTYTTTGFRILPRLTSLNPTSGVVGAAITVNGNHLCQNNAVCPSAFDASNRVTFTSAINTTVFTSWSSTAIVTAVPTSALDGVVYLMSNAYQSNNSSAFSVLTPAPNVPTALNQFKDAALTSALTTGALSSSTNIYFTSTMSADFAGGTLYQQVEYQPIGTPFACTGTGACATALESAGKAGPGPIDCSVAANACAITAAPTDGVYHWQARTRHFYSSSNYYSSWVSYGGNGENATDFQVDKTGPVITFSGTNACADAVSSLLTNSANISWSLNESATGQIEYSKNSNLSSSVIYPSTPASSAFSHNFSLNNLDSNTTYYFQVKSVDAAGNTTLRPTNSPYCSFMTGNVTQPAKTTKFYVGGVAGTIIGGTATSSDFSIYVPENSVSVKNAFIELTGFSPNSGTNDVAISVNNQATSTYSIASNSNSFKVLYPVSGANLNFDPIGNIFNIQPSLDTNITSAELVFTYSFAP
ncbi:MAG: hypothetical protein WAW11_04585 [Patescibacteria group bacterium]